MDLAMTWQTPWHWLGITGRAAAAANSLYNTPSAGQRATDHLPADEPYKGDGAIRAEYLRQTSVR